MDQGIFKENGSIIEVAVDVKFELLVESHVTFGLGVCIFKTVMFEELPIVFELTRLGWKTRPEGRYTESDCIVSKYFSSMEDLWEYAYGSEIISTLVDATDCHHTELESYRISIEQLSSQNF